jgi:hypothetical protein
MVQSVHKYEPAKKFDRSTIEQVFVDYVPKQEEEWGPSSNPKRPYRNTPVPALCRYIVRRQEEESFLEKYKTVLKPALPELYRYLKYILQVVEAINSQYRRCHTTHCTGQNKTRTIVWIMYFDKIIRLDMTDSMFCVLYISLMALHRNDGYHPKRLSH